jgi:hypothetical protein
MLLTKTRFFLLFLDRFPTTALIALEGYCVLACELGRTSLIRQIEGIALDHFLVTENSEPTLEKSETDYPLTRSYS